MRTRFQSQPLFFLFLFSFFSLPPPHHVSPAPIFLFFERRGLLSSRLFQGDEIFIFFFSISRRTHSNSKNEKSVFRLGRPEIGFRNFELPSLPLYFIGLPPRRRAPSSLSYERMNERMNEPRTERMVKTTTSSSKRRRLCRSPSPHSLLRGDEEPKEKEGREESKKVSKTVEEREEEKKLCLDERGRVHAVGNAKLEYASTSSVLFSVSSSEDEQIRQQNQGGLLKKLLRDCKKVFTAKQTLETESYSAGSTFWISATAEPNGDGATKEKNSNNKNYYKNNNKVKKTSLSGLERLALRVFKHVTKRLKEGEDYDSKTSGAEWWTQVIDPRDDIGAHFDKDYYLEENMNVSVHPQVGTVTYLSDTGAPTVVATRVVCQTYFDDSNPKCTNDMLINESNDAILNKKSRVEDSVYISWPKIGKITTFDGRCLHAAPSALSGFPEEEEEEDVNEKESEEDDNDDDGDEENSIDSKRITFLVNVWLNHKPILSENLPEEVRETLEFGEADFEDLFEKNEKAPEAKKEDERALNITTRRRAKLAFTHCDENLVYEYSVPEFCFESGAAANTLRLGKSLLVPCTEGALKRIATI